MRGASFLLRRDIRIDGFNEDKNEWIERTRVAESTQQMSNKARCCSNFF